MAASDIAMTVAADVTSSECVPMETCDAPVKGNDQNKAIAQDVLSISEQLVDDEKKDETTETKGESDETKGENEEENQDEKADGQKPAAVRKRSLGARVLAELGNGDIDEAIARANARLQEEDRAVEEAKQKVVEAEEASAQANEVVLQIGEEVKLAVENEFAAASQLKEIAKRQKEAAKITSQRKAKLDKHHNFIALLELEVHREAKKREQAASFESEQDAKRQKMDELQRLVEETKKAQEELRQKEREAKEAMRLLVKEQRLGPFGRRQRRALQVKAAASAQEGASDAQASDAPQVGEAAAPAASTEGAVPVKREVLSAFRAARKVTEEQIAPILIEDSQ
eukprot:TRINITY_DN9863_c1_g1_i1.p1 TRINITY_DN9863_c1_g1~~TRINITY_DN9863_c1_g1_i1.p1  ORF type:complete len:362 (+),score=139.18 TRINITY_DN9863_c1_g1_i1:61-1086(+)